MFIGIGRFFCRASSASTARPMAAKRPLTAPRFGGGIDQFEQPRRARIERMEAVAEARHMADAALGERVASPPPPRHCIAFCPGGCSPMRAAIAL